MKALIICGSMEGGFTSEMCRYFANGLAVHNIRSDILYPIEMDIRHCTGCEECSKDGKCIINDEMELIYQAYEDTCDLLVLASPIHFSGPSSIIKTVIDRFQPIWYKRKKHPEFIAALLSGGGASPSFAPSKSIFVALSATARMKWLGQLEIPDTDNKDIWDVSLPAFDFGEEIAGKIIKDRQ